MVFDVTGSVWGNAGCNLLALGQYNLVLIGIELYWVNKGLLCLYILKKINGDVDRPTNQPTASCLFLKLENRKKAEICNLVFMIIHLEKNVFAQRILSLRSQITQLQDIIMWLKVTYELMKPVPCLTQ